MKTILVLIFLVTAGCNGFKQSDVSASQNQNSFVTDYDYRMTIDSGPYQGRLVVDQIRNSTIKILIPVGINTFVPLGNFNSHGILGRVVQDENSFKTLEVYVPISTIVQSVNFPVVNQLPNGDPLDFLASGEAQHFSFALDLSESVNVHMYLGLKSLVGVFIQTPFDMASSNKSSVVPIGSLIPRGFFSTHPHRPPLNGGSFIFISLPQ